MSDHLNPDPSSFPLDEHDFDALQARGRLEGGLGPDFALACNVTEREHVHARRVGPEKGGVESRAVVMTHGKRGFAVIYLAAPEVRRFAAHLLNIADEIDGTTPLVFHPPGPLAVGEGPVRTRVDNNAVLVPAGPEAIDSTPSPVGLLAGLAALALAPIVRRVIKK